MKSRLEEAIIMEDPDAIASALDEIEIKVPPAKLSQEDKEMQKNAKDLIEKIESNQGMNRKVILFLIYFRFHYFPENKRYIF